MFDDFQTMIQSDEFATEYMEWTATLEQHEEEA